MRIRSERAGGRLAWAIVAIVLLGWVVNWFVVPDPRTAYAMCSPDTPTGWFDCGTTIRDRP